MIIVHETNLTNISDIGRHGNCQFKKIYDSERKKTFFRKYYYEIDKITAYREIFINERINILNQNNITKYYGYLEEKDGEISLDFEFSELGNMYEFLIANKSKNLLIYLKSWIYQIIIALIQIHKQGVIHNDIRLENILLFSRDNINMVPKIADFNNSILYNGQNKNLNVLFDHDQSYLNEENISFQYDYWCLGIVIYQLLFKKSPFNTNNYFKLYQSKRNSDFLKEKEFSNISPYFLRDLLEKLLKIDEMSDINDDSILNHPLFNSNVNKTLLIKRKRKRLFKDETTKKKSVH